MSSIISLPGILLTESCQEGPPDVSQMVGIFHSSALYIPKQAHRLYYLLDLWLWVHFLLLDICTVVQVCIWSVNLNTHY
ncbi:hypothetical protein CsSME_00047958 [Camellia sinensis var. sinensis]